MKYLFVAVCLFGAIASWAQPGTDTLEILTKELAIPEDAPVEDVIIEAPSEMQTLEDGEDVVPPAEAPTEPYTAEESTPDTSILPDWLSELGEKDWGADTFRRNVLSVYIRPQMLLHRHPQLVGGVEFRPFKRYSIIGEYGYGLDYSIFSPERHGKQVHERWRVALLKYKKDLSRKKQQYGGIEFFWFPLTYFSEENVLLKQVDGDRQWFSLQNATIESNSWGIGFVNGTVFKSNKRGHVIVESSWGYKNRNNKVLNEEEAITPLDRRPGMDFLGRPVKNGVRGVFYMSMRLHFSYRLFGADVIKENAVPPPPTPNTKPKPRLRL